MHNKLKKVSNNSLDLPLNLCEGVDAEFMLSNQRERGLMHLALANKVKVEFLNALAHAIPKLDVDPTEVQPVIEQLVMQMTDVAQRLNSLPNIFAAV